MTRAARTSRRTSDEPALCERAGRWTTTIRRKQRTRPSPPIMSPEPWRGWLNAPTTPWNASMTSFEGIVRDGHISTTDMLFQPFFIAKPIALYPFSIFTPSSWDMTCPHVHFNVRFLADGTFSSFFFRFRSFLIGRFDYSGRADDAVKSQGVACFLFIFRSAKNKMQKNLPNEWHSPIGSVEPLWFHCNVSCSGVFRNPIHERKKKNLVCEKETQRKSSRITVPLQRRVVIVRTAVLADPAIETSSGIFQT